MDALIYILIRLFGISFCLFLLYGLASSVISDKTPKENNLYWIVYIITAAISMAIALPILQLSIEIWLVVSRLMRKPQLQEFEVGLKEGDNEESARELILWGIFGFMQRNRMLDLNNEKLSLYDRQFFVSKVRNESNDFVAYGPPSITLIYGILYNNILAADFYHENDDKKLVSTVLRSPIMLADHDIFYHKICFDIRFKRTEGVFSRKRIYAASCWLVFIQKHHPESKQFAQVPVFYREGTLSYISAYAVKYLEITEKDCTRGIKKFLEIRDHYAKSDGTPAP